MGDSVLQHTNDAIRLNKKSPAWFCGCQTVCRRDWFVSRQIDAMSLHILSERSLKFDFILDNPCLCLRKKHKRKIYCSSKVLHFHIT